ncbi:MAG: condensation domain-containing protein [Vulcanimicrobiota bacterium]
MDSQLSPAKRALLARRLQGRSQRSPDGLTASPLASRGMERLWFLHRLEQQAPIYNIYCHYRIRGQLEIERLSRAWSELVERHAALRTRLVEAGDQLLRQPCPAPRLALMDQPQDLAQALRALRREPFDPATGPLARAALTPVGPDHHVLTMVLHHIICDGWSLRLLERELGALYSGQILPPLEADYGHFVAWQASHDEGRELAYWHERLACPTRCEVPTDLGRPARSDYACRQLRRPVAAPALRQLAQGYRTTIFTLILAAFKATLCAWVGSSDILVGTPMAGRLQPAFESLVGFFVNTLVLRTCLDGDPTFAEVIERVGETVLQAHEHQRLPFERLVREIKPDRDSGRNPLFSVMFVGEDGPRQVVPLVGLEVEPLELEREALPYDLEARFTDLGEQLVLAIDYDPALYAETTVKDLLEHFAQVLERLGTASELPLSRWGALPSAYLESLNERLSGPVVAHPGGCLHHRFEQQARSTPEAVAVVDEGRQYSYQELNQAANRLAHRLLRQGAGPGRVVALPQPRGYSALVSILGILKTGAAYLPLDPQLPEAVVADRLADSQALVLELEAFDGPVNDPPPAGRAQDILCILYTSASSGPAKRIACPHRGAVHRLDWGSRELPLAPDEVVGQRASLGFVDSIAELFSPLLSGARLVFLPELDSLSRWTAQLRRQRVTRLLVVPSLLATLLESSLDLPALKLVVSSGEALPSSLARLFARRLPQARLVNLYGSTEVAGDITWSHDSSLGRPIDNHRCRIVDEHGRSVARGAVGELLVSGPGLAAGLGPEFATGDLVRLERNGRLDYIGRKDSQVKIRGIRVGLAQVEQLLARHPAVRSCAVVEQAQTLHAFWTGHQAADLQVYVETHLERALRPRLHHCEQLPLTTNGKIDRSALVVRPGPARPAGSFEQKVVRVWSRVLGFEVAPEANFFELGGHSLLGVRLMAALERLVGHPLSVGLLFEAQTARSMARVLQQEGRTGELVVMKPGAGPPLILIPPAGCTLVRYAQLLEHYDGPVLGFEYPPTPVAYTRLVTRWADELAALLGDGPYVVGGACLGGRYAFELGRRLRALALPVALVVVIDTGPSHPLAPRKDAAYWRSWLVSHALSPRRFKKWFRNHLKRANRYLFQPAKVRFERLMIEHLASMNGYRPQKLDAPVLLLESEEKRLESREATWWQDLQPDLEVTGLPGSTHMGLLDQTRQAEWVARTIRRRVEEL